jgi:UDP-N-acetylglucosamine acyltransferase
MIGGNTRVNSDVPPYFLYSGFNVEPVGLNTVGLERAGVEGPEIATLKRAYRLLYRSGLKLNDALDRMVSELDSANVRHLVEFIRASERGICRPSR